MWYKALITPKYTMTTKYPVNVYLDNETKKKLIEKAAACGITGRGCLSKYLTKIANEPIAFLSPDVIKLINRKK